MTNAPDRPLDPLAELRHQAGRALAKHVDEHIFPGEPGKAAEDGISAIKEAYKPELDALNDEYNRRVEEAKIRSLERDFPGELKPDDFQLFLRVWADWQRTLADDDPLKFGVPKRTEAPEDEGQNSDGVDD